MGLDVSVRRFLGVGKHWCRLGCWGILNLRVGWVGRIFGKRAISNQGLLMILDIEEKSSSPSESSPCILVQMRQQKN